MSHCQLEGWLVEPLPDRGRARRPHYFYMGRERSLCGISEWKPEMLDFDTLTRKTIQDDPKIGEPQARRECQLCWRELEMEMEFARS